MRQTPRTVAFILLMPFIVAALSTNGPLAASPDPGLPFDDVDNTGVEPGLVFDRLGGNEWWIQGRLSGAWSADVASVQAMDTGGPWVSLAAQPWSDCNCWWAGTFHIEPNHQVLMRATLNSGLMIDSCWTSHPDGLALCAPAAPSGGGALDSATLVFPAPGDGQVLIGFAAGWLPALEPGQAIAGLPVLARVPQIHLLVVQASDLALAGTLLATVPGVVYIETDAAVQALGIPNDPRFGGQYGPGLLGLPSAWSAAGYGSDSVTVAVLDSGIARSHPDFKGTRILGGYDYVNRDAVPNDDCGHGTHVAGILGANTNNSVGVAGASQTTLLPLKVLGSGCSGSVSTIAKAIVDATDQNANILTMSLGTSTNTRALADAVAYAWEHGAVLLAAAGNGGADNTVHYPAAYNQVIAVSALDANKNLASYSSRGPQVDIAAPGSQIDSTTKNGGYGLMSGTSMATPYVAGVLALALSCAPETSNQALRTALEATAQDLGTVGRDNRFGHGLARADLLVQSLCSASPPANITAPANSTTSTSTSSSPSQSATATTPPSPAPASNFTALFTPAKGVNEWWVEVAVTGSAPISAVAFNVDGGSWRPLPKTSWGTWAASINVPKGSSVVFQATNAANETALSAPYNWMGAPPPAGPFMAYFTPKTLSNEWWVEVAVQGNQPIAKVDVRLDAGAWTTLPRTDWGTWAKSLHVLPGTQATFMATASSGEQATSASYTWR